MNTHFPLACLALLLSSYAGTGQATDQPTTPATGESVTLYRDAMGVPHIFAPTSAGVLYGLGYALSQDRLAGLELALRGARGTRAEILGPSALATDKTARDRQLDDAEMMRMYRAIPREHQMMLRSFVDGINQGIAEVSRDPQHKTPIEFIRWGITPTPWTLLDYISYIASVPKGRDSYELQNLAFLNAMIARYGKDKGTRIFDDVVPISDPDSPLTIPPGEDLAPAQPMPVATHLTLRAENAKLAARQAMPVPPAELKAEASRCLVIGPRKSANGRVLMLQATADGPEVHLHGGGFDSAGFNFAGWGPPAMGRGPQHGWLLTSGHADSSDIFAERLNPKNRYQYWFKGKWLDMIRRQEKILVKGASTVEHEVVWTIHGPVIHWDVEHGIAYSHRYALRGKELDTWVGIVEMQRARSIEEFESKGVNRLGWNIGVCYGGEDGQIAFWEGGLLPKRAPGVDSRLPTPGTGEYEWTGFLSPQERPHMRNPKQGYFHNWNSKATTWSREGDEGRMGTTFRTWLGNRLAATHQGITLLDMREFNRNIFNAQAAQDLTQTSPDFFAPYIRTALAKTNDPDLQQAGALMLSYNGRYEDLDRDDFYDNAGATLFRAWLNIAPDMIFGDDMGDWWHKIDEDRYLKYQSSLLLRALQGSAAGAPLSVDYFNGREREAVILDTLRRTVDTVRAQYPGKAMADWRLPVFWKYYDPSQRRADRPALSGEDEPGHARMSAVLGLGPAMVRHHGGEGWVGLMEIDRDHPAIYTVTELGGQNQFIDPDGKGNPHLTDQTMMHVANEYKKIVMAPDDVRAAAVSTQQLIYSPAPAEAN